MKRVTSWGVTVIFTSYHLPLSTLCGTCPPSTSLVRPRRMGWMADVRLFQPPMFTA
ncbi:MAG: hypothetical protein IJP46_06330 [Prevotella sp.]|nr:hypothetical protein [Prevotella sp.]